MTDEDEGTTEAPEVAEKIATPQILVELMEQFNAEIAKAEAKLQVTESGATIANIQGYCAGFRAFKDELNKAGYDTDFNTVTAERTPWESEDEEDEYASAKKWEFPYFLSVHEQITALCESEGWKTLHESLEVRISDRKDFLFFKSDKGRDLYWCKGWYRALNQLDDWIEKLAEDFERAKREKEESLPFDDDDTSESAGLGDWVTENHDTKDTDKDLF